MNGVSGGEGKDFVGVVVEEETNMSAACAEMKSAHCEMGVGARKSLKSCSGNEFASACVMFRVWWCC